MATLTETKARPERKPLPAPNSDFYRLAETLPPEELAVVKQVRAFMESKVAPIITKYWADDAFPFELLPAFKELNLGGVGMQGYECRGGSALLFGLVAMEMSRVDSSIATFFGVHWSPDGRQLLYARRLDERALDLFVLSGHAGPRRLTETRALETNPVVSPGVFILETSAPNFAE